MYYGPLLNTNFPPFVFPSCSCPLGLPLNPLVFDTTMGLPSATRLVAPCCSTPTAGAHARSLARRRSAIEWLDRVAAALQPPYLVDSRVALPAPDSSFAQGLAWLVCAQGKLPQGALARLAVACALCFYFGCRA